MHQNTQSDNRAIAHIFANVLLWSFFPLFAEFSTRVATPFAIAFYAQVIGAVCAGATAHRKISLSRIRDDCRENGLLIFILSMASYFLSVFFLWSVTNTSSLSATIILELWPFFALVFGATLISKTWEGLHVRTVFLFFIGAIGLVLLALLESNVFADGQSASIGFSFDWSGEWPVGSMLAVIAAVVSGLTVVQTELYYRLEETESWEGAAYTIFVCRLAAIVPAFIFAAIFDATLFDVKAVLWGAVFGVVAYYLASMFAIIGLRYSRNIANMMLWYFAPIIAGIWLLLFSDQKINDVYLVAFIPIIFANIFSNLEIIRRQSFFVMSGATMAIGLYLYVDTPPSYARFYEALAVVMAFYAIIVSFVLHRKLTDLRAITIVVENMVWEKSGDGWSNDDAVNELSRRLRQIDDSSDADARIAGEQDQAINKAVSRIVIERTTSMSFGENVVLCMISLVVIMLSLFFRGEGLAADMVALVSSVATIFLTTFTLEASSRSFQWRIVKDIFVTPYARRERERETTWASIVATAIMLLIIMTLLYDKWIADIFANYLI